jgi:hypothetical protein
MDYMAKGGLLMRGHVAKEIENFTKIGNLLRACFINKTGLLKIQSHYDEMRHDISRLVDEANEKESRLREEKYGKSQSQRDYKTETLSQ